MPGRTVAKTFAILTIVAFLAWCAYQIVKPRAPLNVILISIDTLRPDRMGVYGHRPLGRSTTEFLDEFASRGALFGNAVSTTSWTLPAHYSLMTGVPNDLHNVVQDRVPPSIGMPMLAEVVQEAGYSTGGFYSGPYLHPIFGFEKGFEVYESCMKHRTMYDVDLKSLDAKKRQSVATANEMLSQKAVTSETVTKKGLQFIADNLSAKSGGEPFFLFLHYFDVHNDYLPPAPFDKQFGRPYSGWVKGEGVTYDPRYSTDMDSNDLDRLLALYDGEIAWVDLNLRHFFEGIDALDSDLLNNTLVIITSDHGEEFFEHGEIAHRSNLYQPQVRIPLIVVYPAEIGNDLEIDACATIYDIFPTVADFAGIEIPDYIFGRSLRDTISGNERSAPPAILELTDMPKPRDKDKRDRFKKHTSLIFGDMKLIHIEERKWSEKNLLDFDGPLLDEHFELFDLRADPAESHDIAAQRKDLVDRMLGIKKDLSAAIASLKQLNLQRDESGPVEIPAHIREQLDQLGY